MSLAEIFALAINAILIENFVLVKFLGCCPFLGVSKKSDTAVGMGLAVTFVMAIASAVTWMVNEWVLIPLNMGYMQTVAFILIIASLVQFVEMVLAKMMPALHKALGIYLPLITTNCAVLGITILHFTKELNYLEAIFNTLGAGVGFMVAMVMFAGVRQRLESADIPKSLQGLPITLISAAIVALSFLGFAGIVG